MAFYTNREKYEEVQREVKMRLRVFAKQAGDGPIPEGKLRQIDIMKEIAEDYRVLAEQRDLPL